jgi:hypothetical protein
MRVSGCQANSIYFISQRTFLQTTDREPHAEAKLISSITKKSLRNPTQIYETCHMSVETVNTYKILIQNMDHSESLVGL